MSSGLAKDDSLGMTSWLSKTSSKAHNRDHNNSSVFDKNNEQYIAACNPISSSKGEVQALPSAAKLIAASKI
eukprot:9475315-Ditylum_brightwellii.AAC.1